MVQRSKLVDKDKLREAKQRSETGERKPETGEQKPESTTAPSKESYVDQGGEQTSE